MNNPPSVSLIRPGEQARQMALFSNAGDLFPLPRQPLYTWGYTTTKLDDIVAYRDMLGALVVDIRLSPRSRVPHWTGPALRKILGNADYIHVPALGNINYKEHDLPVKIADPVAGLTRLRPYAGQRALILLCGCEHASRCHRLPVSIYLADALGFTPVHLPGRVSLWGHAR